MGKYHKCRSCNEMVHEKDFHKINGFLICNSCIAHIEYYRYKIFTESESGEYILTGWYSNEVEVQEWISKNKEKKYIIRK